MARQNRVLPTGDIVADPHRGLFMGNRGGRIHTDAGTLSRARWRSPAWLICVLSFKGRQRQVMGKGYTELFFLDEVTALAAGHRPCFECRRHDAIRFATLAPGEGRTPAPDLDRCLHAERLGPREALRLDRVPDGTMALVEGKAVAIKAGQLLEWSPDGYRPVGPVSDTVPKC